MDHSDLNVVTWPYQLTEAVYRDLYPALDPSRPELSAKGQTVLITGVSGGVGKVSKNLPSAILSNIGLIKYL